MTRVKRVILAVLGAIFGLLGVAVMGAGAVLLALFGTDGQAEIPIGRVTSDEGRAVVVTDFQISSSTPVPLNEAWFDLGLRVDGDQSHFVGVTSKQQALDFLQGVPYDLVTQFDSSSGAIASTAIPGDRRLSPAEGQSFWIDKQTGDSVTVAWPVSDEDTALVITNTDGSRPVAAGIEVLLTIAWAGAVAIGLLVAGLIVAIIAIVLLISATRARSAPDSPVT